MTLDAGESPRVEEVDDVGHPSVHGLVPLVDARLRRLACAFLRNEGRGQTLSPSQRVHEICIRPAKARGLARSGTTHFFALAAREMRRILREHAEERMAARHGGGLARVSLPDEHAASEPPRPEILARDEFVDETERRSLRRARVIEMRVFAGMTEEGRAAELEVTVRTVRSVLAVGRARLARFPAGGGRDGTR